MASGEAPGKAWMSSGESRTLSPLMLQEETLQQVGIKPVHVVDQLVETILVASKPQVEGDITQRGMLVHQQALLSILPQQGQRQMDRQGSNSGSAFGPHQGDDTAPLALQAPSPPRLYVRQCVNDLVRLKGFDQEL